jgi:cyanate permease
MGWIRDQTGSYTGGMLAIAASAVVAMVIVLALRHDRALETTAGKVAAE